MGIVKEEDSFRCVFQKPNALCVSIKKRPQEEEDETRDHNKRLWRGVVVVVESALRLEKEDTFFLREERE